MAIPSLNSIRENIPLAPMTTLQLGGKARYLATPSTKEEFLEALRWAQQHHLPFWILGGGSNVVIADRGVQGLLLQCNAQQCSVELNTSEEVQIRVEAGHEWDKLVAWTVEQGWAGIECLSGIPGRVGAAPIQNIGAYGQEISEVFVQAEVLDLKTQTWEIWDRERCQFSYRHSAFKAAPGRYFVYAITLSLRPGGSPTIRYGELKRRMEEKHGGSPTLAETRALVLLLRRQKSMVSDPLDPNSHSAGSFFINPILPQSKAAQVKARLEKIHETSLEMPSYPVEKDGYTKLSAAWLIERSGLHKGYGTGRIGLSQKHTLALVNRGGGTASELVDFACFVQRHVHQSCGVQLQPEPNFLGFESHPLIQWADEE